jgi:putative membrane-bound dehydrogenase-like protein
MKQHYARPLIMASCLGMLGISAFQANQTPKSGIVPTDSLREFHTSLVVHPEVQITTFATEPMLKNPTNMDIDSKGRVWITEAYNYRPAISGNPTNPKGDRILILEDTNGDGVADSQKIFYQSPELNAPLGIAVLDSMVIVSQSPYIWKMFDDNRDGVADRKEILFQGIGGEQHDHGAHAFSFGPDGKLYFNIGNEGKQLLDAKGKPVLDQDGDPIGPTKYKQGMAFRCNLDGSQVECLGHNFRNNFEVAVDSYGALWQSDNDDDGNKGVRINAVFEHGNYGYTDEMTGAGWSANRTNIEPEIPLRHWHLNDPGSMPNLLQTGSGSPTGMIVYEGNLLPTVFQGQIIHTDAGPNVVRAYPVKPKGAGYEASIVNLIDGSKDQWFRPADVTVAPDGSVFVADWYDPGVGGHQAGDQTKGRIYRIAPKGHAYRVPALDLTTPSGALAALNNPNLATRYLGYQKLVQLGLAGLETAYSTEKNPRLKARALWMLIQGPKGASFIEKAVQDSDPNFRMLGIRAMKRLPFASWQAHAQKLQKDPNPQVRRELAIALRHITTPEADAIWTALALQYESGDRWYLEALGIGADGNWDTRLSSYLASNQLNRDVIWRARSSKSVPYLVSYVREAKPLTEKLRYFRAFDFVPGNEKSSQLMQIINESMQKEPSLAMVALRHISAEYIQQNPAARKTVISMLAKVEGNEYLELIEKYNLTEMAPSLLKDLLAGKNSRPTTKVIYALNQGGVIQTKFKSGTIAEKKAIIEGVRWQGNNESLTLLLAVVNDPKIDANVRRDAARGLGNSYPKGEDLVLKLLKNKEVPTNLIPSVVESVSKSWRKGVRMEAITYLTGANAQAKVKHPPLNDLLSQRGVVLAGKKVYVDQCSMCHQVNNEGIDFGPKLGEIGSKLSREGMYMSVLHPNAGIGFGYETFEISTKKGDTYQGIIVSKNETDIIMRLPGGVSQNFKTSGLKSVKQLPNSLMPEGLADGMSTPELVDLMEYLNTLKKK